MLYNKEEIERIIKGVNEGKSLHEALYGDEPEYNSLSAFYECLEENRRSFSLIKTIYNLIKKQKPVFQESCADCLSLVDNKRLVSNH